MNNLKTQLTIRGIDTNTKKVLVSKANKEGISLNRYIVKTLESKAGLDSYEDRLRAIKSVLNQHSISKSEVKAINEAVARADVASKSKQKREKDGISF